MKLCSLNRYQHQISGCFQRAILTLTAKVAKTTLLLNQSNIPEFNFRGMTQDHNWMKAPHQHMNKYFPGIDIFRDGN